MHHASMKKHRVANPDFVSVRAASDPARPVYDDEELTEAGLVFSDLTARLEVQHVRMGLARAAS